MHFKLGSGLPNKLSAAGEFVSAAVLLLLFFVVMPRLIQRVMKADANAAIEVFGKDEQGEKNILDFIIARGGKASLLDIEAPKAKWSSAGQLFDEVYTHEQKVTAMIHGLVDLAIKEKDYATFEMLQWFVKEQVEDKEHSCAIPAQIQLRWGCSRPPVLS